MKFWGYRAEKMRLNSDDLFYSSRFKLHLAERSSELDLPPLPPGTTVVDVIASYMRGLVQDAVIPFMKGAARHFGDFDIRNVRWCLTVPAIWSLNAKEAMLLALVQAGM